MRPLVFVALASALFAAPAAAQLTSKQATAELKAAAKTRTSDLKAQLAELQDTATTAIESYEDHLAEHGFDANNLVGLFEALNTHVGGVSAALFTACQGFANDASDLLAQITDEEVLAGTPPASFSAGLGSTFDDARVKLASMAEKSQAAVFKRLGKTLKALDKLGVNAVAIRRPLPASNIAFAPDASGTTTLPEPMNLTIDLALSFSLAATDDDGVVCEAGQASALLGDIFAGAGVSEEQTTPGDNQRWTMVHGFVTGLVERDTMLTVGPATGGMQDTSVIAIR